MNIIFSDIDGTFQDLGADVPQINIDAIKALQKNQDKFVFVTGRGLEMVEELQEASGLACDAIFANGAGLKKVGQAATYQNCLSIDTLERILPILDAENILYFVHTTHEVLIHPVKQYHRNLQELRESLTYMGEQGISLMDYKTNYFEESCYHVADMIAFLTKHPDRAILKVELMEASDTKHQLLREKLKSPLVTVFTSFVKTLEIVHPLSSKGSAIQNYLKDYTDVTSFGFGDGENDLPMFEVVDVAVAVENATEHIKQSSHHQTVSCQEGGVGKFIFEKILLNEQ